MENTYFFLLDSVKLGFWMEYVGSEVGHVEQALLLPCTEVVAILLTYGLGLYVVRCY